jgi:hypothetical protein
MSPLATIESLMARWEEGRAFPPRPWTINPPEVTQRLREAITPSLFEGLVVSLLQLEEPHLSWLGVGGSGDGGIDGVASDDDGDVVSVLQCKWAWDGGHVFGQDLVWPGTNKPLRRVFAHMTHRSGAPAGADLVWDVGVITELLLKHAHHLPLAVTLRVGHPLVI